MVNVYVFDIGSIYIDGKRITQNIFTPSKIQGTISRWNRCLTYLNSRYWNNRMRFLEGLQLTEKILDWKNYLWSVMKKSSFSRTGRFTYFQILCFALERWTRTQNQILLGKKSWLGSRVHHNTKLWTQLMVSQWDSSGIFPRIHDIAALQQSPRVHV